MILETKRLILRPWQSDDEELLYEYASNSKVADMAGWAVHASREHSQEILLKLLMVDEIYAVVVKDTGRLAGSIGFQLGGNSTLGLGQDEAEIGYWIAYSLWGRGYAAEAVARLLSHGFHVLGLNKIWARYFEGNDQSKRVLEKSGFHYLKTEKNLYIPAADKYYTTHLVSRGAKEQED